MIVHKYKKHGEEKHYAQTAHEWTHSTACGYVRARVTNDDEKVTCKLCLRAANNKWGGYERRSAGLQC